jgi:biopolymer transport protein ExbB
MEAYSTYLDIAVFSMLGIMSLITFTIWLERIAFYRNLKIDDYANKKELEIDLSNNLTIISTIAANAPYVGLLGTVFGIILTFYTIGIVGVTDSNAMMMGLALALKATAFGLIVAIPAIVFHNYLVRRMEVMVAQWEIRYEDQKN